MLLLLVLAATDAEVAAPAARPMPVTQPTGARGARPLGTGYAITLKGVGSLADTPLGMLGADVGGALSLSANVDVFGGARLALSPDPQHTPSVGVPYVGARVGGTVTGRIFYGLELSVSAAVALPQPSNVTWVIEPAGLVSFTALSWLELTVAAHALSAPQLGMWGVGPGFQAALRLADHWSLLIEMKTLVLRSNTGYSAAPTLALGAVFH